MFQWVLNKPYYVSFNFHFVTLHLTECFKKYHDETYSWVIYVSSTCQLITIQHILNQDAVSKKMSAEKLHKNCNLLHEII